MLPVNKIPHLRIYRQKMILPYDQQDKKKGSLIIANTKTFDGPIFLLCIKYNTTNDTKSVKTRIQLFIYFQSFINIQRPFPCIIWQPSHNQT